MLTGVHFLLTYQCTFECDHCFVFGSPTASGTFTIDQVRQVLDQAVKLGSVTRVYFEGGEPFLFYPLLIESIREARRRGLEVGIVTNGYYATSAEDAELWFASLRELGVADLSLSDDAFHSDEAETPAQRAMRAAKKLGLPAASICIDKPTVITEQFLAEKGKPVVGGDVMFRGRAAELLVEGLPTRPCEEFSECPHEELEHPERVHVDPYGNVQLCQGLCIGNMWQTPLTELVRGYRAREHPIAGPLLQGGPARLAKQYGFSPGPGYVDACHLCYAVRKALLERFSQYLAPRQLYGQD